MNQAISEIDGMRKYRTELPNIADDELDPYQYRLYGHYKRVCGASGGTCFESVRTTAERTKMSAEKVISTRQWLAENKWIETEEMAKGTLRIIILDKWEENFDKFSRKNTVRNSERTTRKPLEIPNELHAESDEIETSSLEIPNDTVRNSEHKKELYKKELVVADATPHAPLKIEEKKTRKPRASKVEANLPSESVVVKPPTEHQMMFEKICQIVGWDYKTLDEKAKGQVAQTLGILKAAGYTLDELKRFGREVWSKDWRWTKKKEYPTLTDLRQEIGKVKRHNTPHDINGYENGTSWKQAFASQKTPDYIKEMIVA